MTHIVAQRSSLPYLGVFLECLDEDRKLLGNTYASGFIRQEEDKLFLYTCWHVVSGFNPNDVCANDLPKRRFLKVSLQDVEQTGPFGQRVGSLQTHVIPLYDSENDKRPLWLQDECHVPDIALNSIGLFVPYWFDVVKIELPAGLRISPLQMHDESESAGAPFPLGVGDKCFIVGFPHGYSAFGPEQPTAIVLTRFVAGDAVWGQRRHVIFESIGAPGMSGGPVFVERNEKLHLVGIYTGCIYPDHPAKKEAATALGVASDLSFLISGHRGLVAQPTQAINIDVRRRP